MRNLRSRSRLTSVLVSLLVVGICEAAASQGRVELTLIGSNDKKTISVDPRLSELKLGKSVAMMQLDDVVGIERLRDLRTVIIDMPVRPVNYSFLAKNPGLQRVVLVFCRDVDLGFLRALPNLRSLYIRESNVSDLVFDLSNNQRLEYLEISSSNLDKVPEFRGIPKSLRYLNLMSNNISQLADPALATIQYIFLWGNQPYAGSERNVMMGDPWKVIPKEYRQGSS